MVDVYGANHAVGHHGAGRSRPRGRRLCVASQYGFRVVNLRFKQHLSECSDDVGKRSVGGDGVG